MTSRQRWQALFDRQTPDRIPTDYWATGEFSAKLRAHLGLADDDAVCARLHIDRPRGAGARYTRPLPPDSDMWGIGYRHVNYGSGAYREAVVHPLAGAQTVQDIHAHRWPEPDDFDYAGIPRHAASLRAAGHVVSGPGFEPFLLYCSLRGMEQAYEDLLVSTDIADAIFGHIFDVHYEVNRRILQAAGHGGIDYCYVAEDLGSQTGPLMSLETYRRFLRPNQKKMADLARSFGAHIFYHTDGSARVFLPDLIDIVGIEILNPIQWRCPGMERQGLIRDFGRHIIFHGAMDNQQTLPFGTVEDVRREVHENVALFANCRWICAPCHNIQAITPPENIVALYDTIHEIGGS